ncbi:hypothetical protein ROZALSC1DRAFT_23175 [Rozella allomycis CSF55]|uniref:Uncharacterized protein n=1 Tax=Rozella allomycis (strain CSF55) TaxID=988480 RepID=A0A4P9YGT2_ROZAC|nr:hypothetical protein ROZALSC1DRAFT_23175 [Rozella allomycis CSF55]
MFEKERQEKFERERVIERELQEKIERERVMDRERIDKLANVEGGRDVVKIEKEMKDAIKDDKGREIPNDINPELIELFGRLIFQTNQRREIMKNLFDELKNNENFYRSNLENSQLALKDLKEKFEIYKIDSLKDLNENENISNEKIKNFIQEIEILNNSNNFFKSQIDSLNLQLNSLYNENKKLKNNGRNFNGNSFSKFVENFSGKSFSNSTGNATGNSIHATSPSADESSLLLKLQVKKLEDLIQSFTPSNNQTYSNHFTIRRLENQVNSLNRRLNMKSF